MLSSQDITIWSGFWVDPNNNLRKRSTTQEQQYWRKICHLHHKLSWSLQHCSFRGMESICCIFLEWIKKSSEFKLVASFEYYHTTWFHTTTHQKLSKTWKNSHQLRTKSQKGAFTFLNEITSGADHLMGNLWSIIDYRVSWQKSMVQNTLRGIINPSFIDSCCTANRISTFQVLPTCLNPKSVILSDTRFLDFFTSKRFRAAKSQWRISSVERDREN